MKLSNSQQHLKLLEVPSKERNKHWFNSVNMLLTEIELHCDLCGTTFTKKVFSDEIADEPKNQLCIICADQHKD